MKKRPFGLAPSPFLLLHLFAVCLFGTARVADSGVSIRAVFDVSGVKGHITFQQLSPNEPGTIALSLSGLAQFPGQRFDWLIHSTPVASLPGSCQRLAMDINPVFDPLGRMAVFGDNYTNECSRNQSLCAVGDLSGKHGQLNDTVQNVTFDDRSVDLFGRLSVIGRVVVVYLPGDALACANIAYPTNSINGIAPFRNIQSMLLGNIWFREVVFPRTFAAMVQTTVFADLVTTSMTADSTGHNWLVHVNAVGNGSMCSVAGPQYNPEGSSCSPLNQSACGIGDLSGKSSPLDFSSGEARLFYHDTNLPLEVSSEGFSIVNRSVVVYERNGSEVGVACADIRALPRRQAIASFDVEGVVGHILFEQSTPFDSTSVAVQLDGLQLNAEGYHIHDTPVGATQTDCDEQITGGHFDPWMVGGSPTGNSTTSDDYEAGDLSGKFGDLSNLPSINASFDDPFIPLFGLDSIIARSVVIHRPGGERWVCANVTHLQLNVTLVAAFNSSEVKGQVVFTQLQADPLSEAAIFVDFFQVDIPLVTSSTSSVSSLAPTSTPVTLSSLSTSSDAQPMSQSSDFVMPSVTMTTVVMATSTVPSPPPTSITSSTTSAVLQASSTSISEEAMTFSTALVSSSSTEQPRLSPSSTTTEEADTLSLAPSLPLSSSVSPMLSASSNDRLSSETSSSLESTSLAPSPPLSSSVSPMLSASSSDRLSSETSSSMESSLEPTPNMPPVKRRRRDDRDTLPSEYPGTVSSNRHRRQSLPIISWSIRDSCNSSPPVSTPGCGPSSPLVCAPGDLDGKHGQLAAVGPLRRVFTDPFLPLAGDQSVDGSVLVLELGPDMLLCASIAPLSQTPTTPPTTPPTTSPTTPSTSSPTIPPATSPTTPPTTSPTTPPTAAPTSPEALTLPVIIGLAVVCVSLVAVCVVTVILIVCICCCIKRRRKYGLWEDAETRRNGGYHSPDLELAPVRFTPSPSQKYAPTYRVVMDYEPLLGEHLPLKKGETVIVLEREREGSATPTSSLGEAEGGRDEMWKGKIGDAVGWFPAKNVEQVPLDDMNLSEDEREEAVKRIGIDRAAEVIIAASKSFSIHKPNEVQPSGKKAHRSRSFGANAGHTTSSRNSPAPSVSSVRANEAKLKELPRARSSATPLPWITVHNLTKDKIDSTPVTLKKHDQVGKHNSYVSDDINVVLEDISPLSSAPPVSSVALTSAGSESRQQDDVPTMRVDKNDAAITSYEYRASFAYDGDNPDDLLFMEGDIVNVTWAEDSGWWYGTAGTRVGWFPGSFVEPVDMSDSEGEEGDDDGFLSDPPVDTPLDLTHVEIDVGKAEDKDALEVNNIVMELQVDEKESHSQRMAEPLSTSSPVAAELELDHSPTAMGDFTAEIMTMFVNKNAEQASTLEALAREQPQAPSPEEGKKGDQTHKDESQRGTVEGATSTSKAQPPSVSPRKKLRKEVKEQKRQPQRRAPPPPPAGTKSKETSNPQLDHQTTTATQPATQIAQTTEPIQQSNSQDAQRETTALKPKRKPPAVPTEKKAVDTAPSSSLAAVGQEKATRPVPVGAQEQNVAGKEQEATKTVLVPRRRAPGVPAGKRKPRSQTPHERHERARSARPAQQLRRMRPIPPPPSMPCPPPPIKPRTKLKQKQHSSSDDQPSEPAAISSSAPSSMAPIPAERKKANSSITAILQAALDEDDTGAKAETRAAPSAASPPVVTARQLPKKEDTVTARPPASTNGTTEPPQKQKPPKPPVLPKTKAAVDAWKRLSTSSFTEEVESGAEGVDRTRQTKKGTGATATDVQEGGKVQGSKPVPAPKPRPPARFSSLSDTAEASANLPDATHTRKEADKPQPASLETIAEKNNAGVVKPSYSPPLPKPRDPGTADEGKPTEGPTKAPATAELNKTEDVADKGRRVSQTGEKPAVPKKPDSLVKATRRQPPAPPPGSPVLGPQQQRGSPFTVRKYKPARPPQLPKLAKQTAAESTTNDAVSVPPGSQPAVGAVEHPAPAKEKPARPPPPTFPEQPRPFRAQPRNVPNTSTFFLGTAPTPAPRKNMPKSGEMAPEAEGEDREDPELSNLKRVISPYTAQRPDELTIRLGDCLSELEPPNSRGLCYGMLDNGQTGLYPADCVENW